MTREEAKTEIATQCGTEVESTRDNNPWCKFRNFLFDTNLLGTEGSGNKKTGFYFYSNVGWDEKQVIGPWFRALLSNNGFAEADYQVRTNRQNAAVEGHVADFYLGIDWENPTTDDFSRIRELYKRLQKFQEEVWPDDEGERNRQIQEYNREHRDDIRAYIAERTRSSGNGDLQTANSDSNDSADKTQEESDEFLSRNLIYFGAPGTGKSHKLKEQVDTYFANRDRYERVTFYPTYSYAQFVGCYKPVMKPANGGKEEITYEFVPGPFLRMLVKALEKPNENHCLVIEEINRANAAAVFGDVFQLLDRGSDGVSEYEVAASEDVKSFLQEKFKDCSPSKDDDPEESKKRNPLNFLKVAFKKDAKGNDTKEWDSCRLRIPSNMYIWATMNSADQGVFPMDTAFKRRWTFKYFQIDESDEDVEKRIIGTNSTYQWTSNDSMKRWNNVRKFVNRLLTLFKVNEDKLMGPWFVQPESGDKISAEQFESKVLMYLWEDAARMCRQKMFPNSVTSYSELITEWRKHGVGIFDHLMGDNQIGGKDKNTDNSATKLWGALDMPKQQQ